MIIFAILFLIIVILLRFTGNVVSHNVVGIVGAMFGEKAESVPLLSFQSVDFSGLNPANWSPDHMMTGINEWLHKVIDTVLPAVIQVMTISMVHAVVIARMDVVTATIKVTRFAPFI